MTRRFKVALVIPGFPSSGGLTSVGNFLHEVLRRTEEYEHCFVSIASSRNDIQSVRLLSPGSWARGISKVEKIWQNETYICIGSFMAELEFQRYRPRRILTDLLNEYDLIQIVAGSPAWAYIARDVVKPICLQVATLAHLERAAIVKHASIPRKILMAVMTPLIWRLEKVSLQSIVDHVFADGEYTRQAMLPYIDVNRISLGPPGVDTRIFRPIEYRTQRYILSVGRFADPRKNVALLFKAYGLLKQQSPDLPPLILAGSSPPSSNDWKQADIYGIINNIIFYQNVTLEQLVSLYQNATLFVLSSDEEGLGIVLLEAMACGVPVVATRCGGPDSVVLEGKTGFLTPIGDSAALAEKVKWLLNHPEENNRMGKAGRLWVEQHFSIEAAGKVFLDVYKRLLQDR